MTKGDLLRYLAAGYVLEARRVGPLGLTERRALVKGEDHIKGVPQALTAAFKRADLIECDDYKVNPQVWRLTSWGRVVAERNE